MDQVSGDTFKGLAATNDIVSILTALEAVVSPRKGEFETTAEFKSRRDELLAKPFLNGLSTSDALAFVLPVNKGSAYRSGFSYEFDADSGLAKIFVLPLFSALNGIGAPDYSTNRRETNGKDLFDVKSKVESTSTYQASNAYGATVTVEKTVMARFGVVTDPAQFITIRRDKYYSSPQPMLRLEMDSKRAAALLPHLKALIVVSMNEPFVAYHYDYFKPTRDDPKEMSSQGKYLTGSLLGIVLFSENTGEIVARIPNTFGIADGAQDSKISQQ